MRCLTVLILSLVLTFSILLAGCMGMAAESSGGSPPDTEVTGDAAVGNSPERDAGSGEDAISDSPQNELPKKAEEAKPPAVSSEPADEGTRSGKSEAETFDWDTSAATSVRRASVSGLKAGFADDNKQFNYFVNFLKMYGDTVDHYGLDISERMILKILDRNGKSLPNAKVSVEADGKILTTGLSYADGSFTFFPSEFSAAQRYEVEVVYNQQVEKFTISREGRRRQEIIFDLDRTNLQSVPLDMLFIMDTTGSMGEEIQRLKTTIELINLNLSSLSSRPTVRFGMVLYKDRGDEYDTKIIPLTSDLDAFQEALNRVEASGGGDTPEDLQAALEAAINRIEWNRKGVRLSFVITDAPPHLDYDQSFTYVHAAQEAKKAGIKIFTVGTGGLDLGGEYVLRQISQYTAAKYIFLTYGEQGESEGGQPGSVSHHTGANYQTDKLEAIIIRFAREELQHLTNRPIEDAEEYFTAQQISTEVKEETLGKLFSMAGQQLLDYASYRIAEQTPTAVLPIVPAEAELTLTGEYFTEQLIFALSRDASFQKSFRMVERKDLQDVLKELELQMSGLVEDEQVVKVGKLLGAELLITGKLYLKDDFELFMKLLRVETGEILSITKAKLDRNLGL